jgi:hypothetical protein
VQISLVPFARQIERIHKSGHKSYLNQATRDKPQAARQKRANQKIDSAFIKFNDHVLYGVDFRAKSTARMAVLLTGGTPVLRI